MRATNVRIFAPAAIAALLLSSCVYSGSYTYEPKTEHYVSPQIEGASQRINLDEVEKAFFSTKGDDLNSWMSAFEKRVNEIYEGKEIVSIDATRETGRLKITGYVDTNKQPGYQQGEDRLFGLEQTGDVVNNKMPYRVTDERGYGYHDGSYSLFNNPFIQALVVGHLFSSVFGPRYYTPFHQVTALRDYRNTFRSSPSFTSQRTANKSFDTRFKQRAVSGGIRSNNSWGRGVRTSPGYGTSRSMPGRSWGRPSFGGGRSWGGGFRRR